MKEIELVYKLSSFQINILLAKVLKIHLRVSSAKKKVLIPWY